MIDLISKEQERCLKLIEHNRILSKNEEYAPHLISLDTHKLAIICLNNAIKHIIKNSVDFNREKEDYEEETGK